MRQLIVNSLITPDGTRLVSKFRNDYRSHMDKTTKSLCFLDGGNDYIRYGGSKIQLDSIYLDQLDERFEDVRSFVYVKVSSGYTAIKDISDSLLESTLSYYSMSSVDDNKEDYARLLILKKELKYREEVGLTIED